ncbi:MAG: DEAD/DEAH box helicase, partial [Gemmatimonadetes bacterium]|nr:DEAD/DEAH box helicase [Gemmatimonadota bacterium]
ALILTPTRELAAQIGESLTDYGKHLEIWHTVIFGGVNEKPQIAELDRGVDVLVATPGRLLDLMNRGFVRLDDIEIFVLDEADRMLDMGFLPDIRRVLAHIPKARQTLFFSATMPPPIVTLTRQLLHDPVTINLQRKAAPAVGITQAIYPVAAELKSALFVHLLEQGEMDEALVFTRTKHRADRLAKHLVKHGIAAERIHGNRSQAQRTAALAGFKSGQYRVLVATDIVARGIDISELGHVVNFDVPVMPEDYIHRVGRTARAAATGDAFTFVAPDEEEDLRRIERAVGRRLPRVTVPDFDYDARPEGQLEVPIKERIAKIRAEKALARERAKAKAERRAAAGAPAAPRPPKPAGEGGTAKGRPRRRRGRGRGGSGTR